MITLKEGIRIFLVGAAMGVANIIPGVSGGTIAVIFGIYERLMEALGNFITDKKNRKSHIIFLGILFVGALFAILRLAGFLSWSFEHYPLLTIYFFVGLILGSIPVVFKYHPDMNVSFPRFLSFLVFFIFVIVLALFQTEKEGGDVAGVEFNVGLLQLLYYTFCGAIASSAMIIPGVSGSFILLLLGVYWNVLAALSGLTTLIMAHGLSADVMARLSILTALGIGVVIGILAISRFMNWALKNHPAITMYAILGLILGSIYQILSGVHFEFSPRAVVTLILGTGLSLLFGRERPLDG